MILSVAGAIGPHNQSDMCLFTSSGQTTSAPGFSSQTAISNFFVRLLSSLSAFAARRPSEPGSTRTHSIDTLWERFSEVKIHLSRPSSHGFACAHLSASPDGLHDRPGLSPCCGEPCKHRPAPEHIPDSSLPRVEPAKPASSRSTCVFRFPVPRFEVFVPE